MTEPTANSDTGTTEMRPFPEDWQTAVVFVAHPDDPEYGMSAAVAAWTSAGKRVAYVLATSGEAGIEGLDPEECGPLREQEQIRSSRVVGVEDVEFLGFPDSKLENDDELRAALVAQLRERRPDIAIGLFSGPEFAPGFPNQSDHMEFGAALVDAYDTLGDDAPRALYESAMVGASHYVDVDGYTGLAVDALAEHDEYLSVLDPDTPVREQAEAQINRVTAPEDGVAGGNPLSRFRLMAER